MRGHFSRGKSEAHWLACLMVMVRRLGASPDLGPLYVRVVVYGLLRRAHLLGRREMLPDLELVLADTVPDPSQLRTYRRLCGFSESDVVPATYSHVLSFPLALQLMVDRAFPLPLGGLVHVENHITQYRRVSEDERLTLRVRAQNLRPHRKGSQFDLVTDVSAGGERVWRQLSIYLHRAKNPSASGADDDEERGALVADLEQDPPRERVASWRIDEEVSPQYAAVSGDRNPHHLHPLLARLFGFPGLLAHGMWSKARCLSGLENGLPERFTVSAAFERPLLLPATVSLTAATDAEPWRFALYDEQLSKPYLVGGIDTRMQGENPIG